MAIYATVDPTYQPAMRIITSITKANPAVITTTFDHDYITGTIVRIVIPRIPYNATGFGMAQINEQEGTITVLSPTTFSMTIDTTTYDTFNDPGTFDQRAHVVPFGEINEILTAATQNVLPRSS